MIDARRDSTDPNLYYYGNGSGFGGWGDGDGRGAQPSGNGAGYGLGNPKGTSDPDFGFPDNPP